MKPRREAAPAASAHRGAGTAFFFLLFFLYVWLVVDPRLIHHSIGIFTASPPFSFSIGWPLLWEHLRRPGGLVEYTARWLSQWFCFGWAGALGITAAACCAAASTDVLTRAGGGARGWVARYVPAVLLLAIWGGYSHPLRPVLSLLAALACFVVYLHLPWARAAAWQAIVVLIVACSAVYFVAGAGGLLFPVLVAAYELLARRRWLVGAAAVLCALGVPWAIGVLLFGRGIGEAYGGFFISVPGVPAWRRLHVLALYLFFPAVLAAAALFTRLSAWWDRKAKLPGDPAPRTGRAGIRRFLRYLRAGRRGWTIRTAALLLAASAVAWLSLDTWNKAELLVDYYCQREMWPEALAAADGLPYGVYSTRSNKNIMLALCHTGRLGDEMFRYPQVPRADLYILPPAERNAHSYFQESRLFFDLGHVNRAERCACEAFETAGDLPAILEHLALIHVVKDRPETARMFLTALGKKPFYRRAAREMIRRLEIDPALESDPRVSRIRRSMVRVDSVAPQSVEQLLLVLLQTNPHNRMAFELLLAHYLLTGRPDKAVACLEQPTGFEYARLPRHFQEAFVVRSIGAERRLPPAGDRVEQATIDRAGRFYGVLAAHQSSREAARDAALAAGFGDSYFFYYEFGASGL